MTKNNTANDSWGQLLSDFGIEDKTPAEPPRSDAFESAEPVATEDSHNFGVGTGSFDPEAEVTGESPKPKDKKSMFSRFPKINFFGAPPEASLDSVIEGVKSPSLSGKAFIDNKLEKMPLSQEWADRQEKNAAGSGALSAVASQIDTLVSGRDSHTKPKEVKSEERMAKRQVSSMFDDPIPESEEARALKNIMGESPRREGPREDAFLENETDSWQRSGRGRGRHKPQPEEREVRGRGSRHRPPIEENDLPETDFEPMDDDVPRTRGRGRRGSRYAETSYRDQEPIRDDVPQEEWSEVDVALQAGSDEPIQRGGRRQRYDKHRRSERTERPAFDRESSDSEEDSSVLTVHGNIPSWDDAIGDIIAANIARHKSYSGKGRR